MYTEQRRMIVLYELGEDNSYEEQARWVREEDVPPEFEAIMPAEDWEDMSDDRIINMVSGPYVVAAYVDEEGEDGKELADPGDDNWVPYRGPRGGRGFRNTRTDEVVYQGDERFERIRGMVREEFDEREDLEEGEEEADFTPEPADPQTFLSGVKKFVDDNPDYAPMLTIHDAEELEDHEIFTSPDGGAGISISPEGDIQNLFSNRGTKGDALILLRRAIQEGGRTLDCYDGYLYELYSDFGFRVTGRIEFNREFADERWNYERFNEPDVLHMHFDPDGEDDDTYYDGAQWDSLKDQSRQRAVENVPKNMSDTDTETIDELNQRLLDDLREKKGEEWVEQHAELIKAQMDMVGML